MAAVNQTFTAGKLEALRRSVNRGTPFGSERWVVKTASELGLHSTLRPRGRPRKTTSETEYNKKRAHRLFPPQLLPRESFCFVCDELDKPAVLQ